MTALLIIFAKEPVPGQVKTRLSPPLSLEDAARLYRAFLTDILEAMEQVPGVQLALGYSPPEARACFQNLAPAPVALFPQEGEDLGARMARAFAWGFAAGFNPVLLRGSDTPDLPAAVVLEAKEVLESGQAEVVLGPSPDGGYYLVGLGGPCPELFQGLTWSHEAVLETALTRARGLSLRVHLAASWRDIDTYADLLTFLARPHPAALPGWRTDLLARRLLPALAAAWPSHNG